MDTVNDGSMELAAPGSPTHNNKDNPLKLIGRTKKIEMKSKGTHAPLSYPVTCRDGVKI